MPRNRCNELALALGHDCFMLQVFDDQLALVSSNELAERFKG